MILNRYVEDNRMLEKISDIVSNIKGRISFKNIFFIVISLLLANQTFITDIPPFIYVLFGVASLFDVPLILILISSMVSMYIGGSSNTVLAQILSFFVLFTLITSLLNIEGVSKKYSVFIKYVISFFTIQIVFSIIHGNIISELFSNIGNTLIVSILYFIFATGIYVILNKSNEFVSSKEESVSMVVVLSLVMTVFSNISIYSLNLSNILIMVIVLIYGWKNGAITGCAAGVISGLLVSCVNNASMDFVIVLGTAGIFAGIFKNFGKVGIIIAFILGNICLSYYTNNFSNIVLRVSEMLIASLVLLIVPKRVEVKLDNLFNKGQTLRKPYENMLGTSSQIKKKIGTISEVFDNLANIKLENTKDDMVETRNVIKKYITNYVEENCFICKNKQNCTSKENLDIIADFIATKLENNEPISRDMLIKNCEYSDKIIKDIEEVYNSMKLMRLMKKKEKESSEKISRQYKEISNILNNMCNNIDKTEISEDKLQTILREELKLFGYVIYEDEFKKQNDDIEYTFVTDILSNIDKHKKQIISLASNVLERNVTIKLILNSSKKEKSKIKLVSIPNYTVKTAVVAQCKDGNEKSGDSYLSMELQDLKYLNVLSDGVGSGKEASKNSSIVINLIEKLLESGFDEESAIKIINSFIKLKGSDSTFSTLDVFVVDQKDAKAQFIKLGAAPTYILKDSKVTTINNMNIPLGLLDESEYIPIVYDLDKNSIVVQVTDGVISEDVEYNNNFLTKYLQNIDNTKSVKVIADEINKLVLKENKNNITDDFTVIVTKICKN